MATIPNFSQPAIFSEISTPLDPESGFLKVYAKSGVLCSIANSGSEKTYVAISGSGLPIGEYTLPTTDGTSFQVLRTDGSGVVSWADNGITSINGNTTSDQLLTVGTAGTDFAIDSATTAGTSVFNIPSASATARGLVTTGTQTIAGDKTFTGVLIGDGNIYSNNSGVTATIGIRNGSGAGNRIQMTYGTGFQMASTYSVTWSANSSNVNSPDVILLRDAAGILAQRNSTSAQTFRVYNTYTSSTSFETLQIQNVASTGTRIGYAIGSAGGTGGAARQLDFGRWNAAGTWNSLLTWDTNDWMQVNARIQQGTMTAADVVCQVGNTWIAQVGDGAGFGMGSNGYTSASGFGLGSNFTTRTGVGNSGRCASIWGAFYSTVPSTSYYDWRFALAGAVATTSLMRLAFDGTFTLTQPVSTTGSPTLLTLTAGAHTTLTASTECTDVNLNFARTKQFATGALTTQRTMRIRAETLAFVGASVVTTASTLSISGAPVAGTNATITNAYALNVESGSSLFSSYGSATNPTIAIGDSNSGFYGLSTGSRRVRAAVNGTEILDMSSGGIVTNTTVQFGVIGSTAYAGIIALQAGKLQVRQIYQNTTAQCLQIYNTYTSTTSYETLNIKGKASDNFEIGPENGSAGGTLRGLTIGCYPAGTSTITPWLTFTNTGDVAIAATLTVGGNAVVPFWSGTLTDVTPTYTYIGGTPTSGWKINRYDTSGVKTSATVINNGSYATLAAAWTDRISLVYA